MSPQWDSRSMWGRSQLCASLYPPCLTQYLTKSRPSINIIEWMSKWKCQRKRGWVQVVKEMLSKEKMCLSLEIWRQVHIAGLKCNLTGILVSPSLFFKISFLPILSPQFARIEMEGSSLYWRVGSYSRLPMNKNTVHCYNAPETEKGSVTFSLSWTPLIS